MYPSVHIMEPLKEDAYIYRILSFDHLVEWFETGALPLLSPAKWEDPFEKLLQKAVFPDKEKLSYERGRMYGLCFSEDGNSDALWRIYSPTQYGIRIKTTPAKLARAMSCSNELVGGQTFIGKVAYRKTADLVSHARQIKRKLEWEKQTIDVAKTMLLKRPPFRYEKEVRALHLRADIGPHEDLLYCKLDPHEVVETILIDPRAPERRYNALRRHIKELCGYKGRVAQSATYKVPRI